MRLTITEREAADLSALLAKEQMGLDDLQAGYFGDPIRQAEVRADLQIIKDLDCKLNRVRLKAAEASRGRPNYRASYR